MFPTYRLVFANRLPCMYLERMQTLHGCICKPLKHADLGIKYVKSKSNSMIYSLRPRKISRIWILLLYILYTYLHACTYGKARAFFQ